MLVKNFKISVLVMALFAVVFVSCKEDDPKPEPSVATEGVYILNNGVWGSNDSEISYYDFATQNVKNNVYFTQNSTLLGDTGNDIIIYGSKMYCAVTISGKIIVMDKNGKLIKNIQSEGSYFQEPRHFAVFEGKVYVTFKDGYVARIDTTSLTIEKQVKVGKNPEQLAVANRKLYVANSGGDNWQNGYDKTVSVISVDNFSVLKTLEVVPNPVKVQVDAQGDVYVASFYDYNANGALQRIDSKTDVVTKIDGFGSIVNFSPVYDDKMYIIQTEYGESTVTNCSVFDVKNEKILKNQFITDGTTLIAPGCISVEPVSGNVYIGDSPTYTGNGDVYIFSPEGKLLKKIDSGGKNPVRICFVTK